MAQALLSGWPPHWRLLAPLGALLSLLTSSCCSPSSSRRRKGHTCAHCSTLPYKTHILHASPHIPSNNPSGWKAFQGARECILLLQAGSHHLISALSFWVIKYLEDRHFTASRHLCSMLWHPQGDHFGSCTQSQTASSISDHDAHPPAIAVASL